MAVTAGGSTAKSRYIYPGWQRIADYDGTAGTLQNCYIYTDGLDEPVMQTTSGGAVTTPMRKDRLLVSRTALAVTNKNICGTFGDTATLSGTTFGFTGQRCITGKGDGYLRFFASTQVSIVDTRYARTRRKIRRLFLECLHF